MRCGIGAGRLGVDAIHAALGRGVGGHVGADTVGQALRDLHAVLGQVLDPDLPAVAEVFDRVGQMVVTVIVGLPCQLVDLGLPYRVDHEVHPGRRVLQCTEGNAEAVRHGTATPRIVRTLAVP